MKRAYSMFKKALLMGILVSLPLVFFGQDTAKKNTADKTKTTFTPYFFLQGDLGVSWPDAEVATTTWVPDFRVLNFNGNVALGYQFLNWLNVYGNLTRGFANGRLWTKNNTYGVYPGVDLLSKIDYYGGDVNLGVNLSNLFAGYKDRKLSFGLHAGLGQVQWTSRLYNRVTGQELAIWGLKVSPPLQQGKGISKRKIAMTVPVGLDVNYKLNDKWSVYWDYTYRLADTYMMDAVYGKKTIGGQRDGIFSANLGVKLNLSEMMAGTKTMAKKFNSAVKLNTLPQPLVKKGEDVALNIKGTVAPKYFSKKALMMIQPVLTYEGGQEYLKPILLKGEDVAANGELISYKNGGSFNYNVTIPYKPGMEAAELHAAPVIYGYSGQEFTSAKEALAQGKKAVEVPDMKLDDGTIITDTYVELASKGMAPTQPGENSLVYEFAPDGYQKVTIATNTSEIHFLVNSAKLNWGLPMNRMKENYDALKNNLSDLQKGWKVKGVEIAGWASPEGAYDFNQKLSQMRAETAKKYLMSKIKRDLRKKNNGFAFNSVKDVDFTISANGPDWNGFMKAVENSTLKDKNSILNVINSADESKREAEIKNMIQIYPQMAKEILPALRRAVIKVNAFEPKRTDKEISQMAVSADYGQLKINELLYAATLTNDLNTKLKIYDNAMKQYPQCWRAVANAGAVEAAMGNYDNAQKLLSKAAGMNPKAAEVANNMGIIKARTGDVADAEKYFSNAQNMGANVDYNMALVNILKGNYAKALDLMKGVKCDYNLGLAQLLNGDYNAAESTLKCAKETASSDYLLAIVGARQGNKAMAMEYLTKAVKMDSSYAAKAAKDREFLKYFNDPDFKALVNMK
ncbi:MAG: tetratricopeptide repeat protein [Bacteroidales bacterium]|nr:tetratricopeptide repeat protein [Bacteroidales bacterium]